MSKEEILNNWLDQCFETRSLHFDTIGKIHAAMDEYAQQCCQEKDAEIAAYEQSHKINTEQFMELAAHAKDLELTIVELREENKILQRLLGRNPNQKYTYYKLELENMSEEWDETICESLEDVKKQLEYLDVHLDDDTPVDMDGSQRRVIITGLGMTPIEYDEWYRRAHELED